METNVTNEAKTEEKININDEMRKTPGFTVNVMNSSESTMSDAFSSFASYLGNRLQGILERNKSIYDSDSIEERSKNIMDAAKNSTALSRGVKSFGDSYSNELLGIGEADKVESFTRYGFSNDTLNWPLWLTLYNDSWVFRRAIDKPAQDEVRAGITISCESDRKDDVYAEMKRHRSDFIQLFQWGALFGGSVAVVMFDTMKDADYKHSATMNKERLKASKVRHLYVTDRWYGVSPSTSTVSDMRSIDFGKPKYYDITLADGHTVRFHHSYVLRYEHRFAPNLVKNGMLQGWGYAEGSHILNELARDDKLKASIQSLVDKSLIEVVKMAGMRGLFLGQDTESQAQTKKRLEMVNWARVYNSLTLLDKDDDYIQHTFSGLSGLSDLLQENMWLVSSALEMQGVLFGDLKSGFSNDENALERYDETINNRCENYIRPVYQKFLGLIYACFDINEKPEFTFNSLQMKEHDKDRMNDISTFVDLSQKLLDAGVIDVAGFATALQKYTEKGIIDFGLTQEEIEKIKENQKNEAESLDLGGI